MEALELSGDNDRLVEFPSDFDLVENAKFESLLAQHGEDGYGQAEIRVIPSILERKRPSGNGKDIDHSGHEEAEGLNARQELKLREDVEYSGHEGAEENSVREQPMLIEDLEHSGHEEIEGLGVIQQPKLRRIPRKYPEKDPEIHRNVLMI
jgi:hypothetical protein